MNHERIFSVDSNGSAEQTGPKEQDFPSSTKIVVDIGEHQVPLTEHGEGVVTSDSGKSFLSRPSERRVYDLDGNVWYDLPEGAEARDFINSIK